jgi:ethanolamine utilization protein EutP (predicted NTPase)
VDLGGTRGIQRIEEVSHNPTHSSSPGTPRKLAAIHIRYKQCGSTTIVVERGESDTNHKIQYPVYFISKVLSDSKTQYFHIVKLAYALLIMSHKVSHYFQANQIEVHPSLTLGEILNNKEATGKIAKWAIELSMHDIVYKPRIAIKAQALSDFVA